MGGIERGPFAGGFFSGAGLLFDAIVVPVSIHGASRTARGCVNLADSRVPAT